MQRCQVRVTAGIAAHQVQGRNGHVEFAALGVLQHQELAIGSINLQGLQSQVAPHAVLQVHDWDAFAQLVDVAKNVLSLGFVNLAAAAALGNPVAKQLRLAHQCRGVLAKVHAAVDGRGADGKAQAGSEKIGPVRHFGRCQSVGRQVFQQYFPAAGGFGAEQKRPGVLLHEML